MAVKNTQTGSVVPRPNSVPPTNPLKYAVTGHFRKRVAQEGRFITEEQARLTIRDGTPEYHEKKGWRFTRVLDGVRIIVIVDDIETSPVIVTGWTEIADEKTAKESTKWSIPDLRMIRVRAALSENNGRANPDLIRPLKLETPIEVKGHRIITRENSKYVNCMDCNLHTESKCRLSQASCCGWRPE